MLPNVQDTLLTYSQNQTLQIMREVEVPLVLRALIQEELVEESFD